MRYQRTAVLNDSTQLYHFNKNFIMQPLSFEKTLLFQIGRLYCGPQTVIKPHAHINLFELTIVTGGRGVVITNGVETPVERGDIYLSFPGDFHAITTDTDDPLKYDFCAFNSTDPSFISEFEHIVENYMSEDRRVMRDEQISMLVGCAIAEIDGDRLYSHRLLS